MPSSRRAANRKPGVAIVGSGSLASFLAPALREAGYVISEIIARPGIESIRRARALARKVGAKAVTVENAALDASVAWFCVPDREIRAAAEALGGRLSLVRRKRETPRLENRETSTPAGQTVDRRGRGTWGTHPFGVRFAFHSSGALPSDKLELLRWAGVAIASVHPLMTFVTGSRPSLTGVPFALEGDPAATKLARRIAHDLGAESFILPAARKGAYHAWATMTSPLLVGYLVTLEEAAREAGITRERARRMSLPIILQTLSNYGLSGPEKSFSGPLIRGDAESVEKHLALLRANPMTRAVYVALARVALARLPAKNRDELRRLLD